MTLRPITLAAANEVIERWHSHHRKARAHRFAIAGYDGDAIVGVVVVGNPIAQALNDGVTFEVIRLCTNGHAFAASRLLAAAWKSARAMGVLKMVSYTRADEPGTCYRAANWRAAAKVDGREWTTGNKAARWLPGLYVPTTEIVDRVRWEVP